MILVAWSGVPYRWNGQVPYDRGGMIRCISVSLYRWIGQMCHDADSMVRCVTIYKSNVSFYRLHRQR